MAGNVITVIINKVAKVLFYMMPPLYIINIIKIMMAEVKILLYFFCKEMLYFHSPAYRISDGIGL